MMRNLATAMQNNYNRSQRILLAISLLTVSAYFIWMAFQSTGLLEPGDGIVHHIIAKYAPTKPDLFLDHWGKPLFTLLSSPFAQMGFPGMIIFNVILFIITSCLIYRWAEKRKNPFAWLAPLLLISSGVYFKMVNAGMTEILFATVLTVSFFLFTEQKYILGSLVYSFSLFSRPEGMLIMPIYFVFLLWKRQWKAIPFLGFGFVIYAIVGYFHFKDILWYVHNNPYPAEAPFYGHGAPYDFLKAHHEIWGSFMVVLCIVGLCCLIISFFNKKYHLQVADYLLLVVIPAMVVLGVHSYIWWKGIHASLGLTRVISTVVPLFVIISLIALNGLKRLLIERIIPTRYVPTSVLLGSFLLGIFLLKTNGWFKLLPVAQSPQQLLLSEAAEWYKANPPSGKTYFADHYFAFKANINRYDIKQAAEFYVVDKVDPALGMQTGDFFVWDAHFGPNEGGISKEKITENDNIEVVKAFAPKDTFYVLGGYRYEIIMARVK